MGGGAYVEAVNAHYRPADLTGRIQEALKALGKDPAALAPDDLAAVDQFHTGGQESTRHLARLADLQPGTVVLDVGGGIGGPARTLAHEFGCAVTVLDLTAAYVRAGGALTAGTGLADKVSFRQGDALAMPFADASFDLVWTQHSSMNIADKERLYGEIRRVVRPGGRLALHEVMAGATQPVHFPVPWAREPAISFLRPAAEIRTLLGDLGFEEVAWVDTTGSAAAWFRAWAARRAEGGPPPLLGLHLLLGNAFPEMGANMLRNLEEGRVAMVQAVWVRR